MNRSGFLAPRTQLLLLCMLALLATLLCTLWAATTPYLGLQLVKTEEAQGVRVRSVHPNSPNLSAISADTVLVAVWRNGVRVPLHNDTVIEDPDLLDYERYNRFLREQSLLWQALATPPLVVETDGGERIELAVDQPWWSPAMTYALLHGLYGWVALLVALGIWVYNPHRTETRLFAASGVALFATTLTLASYGGRELALPGEVIAALMSVNHLAVLMVCATLSTLFWVYPIRLGRAPVPMIGVMLGLVAWVADQVQLTPGPQYTIYSTILLGFVCGIIIMSLQWRATRGHPLERAALKWCFLSIFVGSLLLIALIMLPAALGGTRAVPLVISLASVLVLYLGLAAGLHRYRLFHVERWWFRTWHWFFGGVLVLALDALLVFVIGLAGGMALLLSLAIAGWVYFPLRQWLMGLLGRSDQRPLDSTLRQLVNNLFAADSEARIRDAWPDLLRRMFNPLQCCPVHMPVAGDIAVSEDGARLYLRALTPADADLMLEHPDRGGRLFRPEDLRVARLLRDLTDKAVDAVRARELGAEAERQRIARDLHDDVGGRILSLLRNAPDEQQEVLARNALQSLREASRALDHSASSRLGDALEDWQMECRARCDEMRLPLQWLQDVKADGAHLSVRHNINIRRILSEALTNAFRHATPSRITVRVAGDGACLTLEVINDGVGEWITERDVLAGRGLNHMRTRAEELGGRFSFELDERQARLFAEIPLCKTQ